MSDRNSWISIAQGLPVGGKVTGLCPTGCSASEKAYINHGTKSYWLYCNKCGHTETERKGTQSLAEIKRLQELNEAAEEELPLKLPDDYTTDIPLHGRLWLYKAGITEPVWSAYHIGYSKRLDRVILPVYDDQGNLEWLQCRALHAGQKPKYLQPARDRSSVMFHIQRDGEHLQRVVVVEDILSAIRVGKHVSACSLLGTKITTAQAAELGKYPEVTTWLDADRAGRSGAYKIRKTLGLITEVDNIVTDKDPKELSDKEIKCVLKI